MPEWLFFTLFAAMLWGVGQIFVKKGLGDISPLLNNIFGSVVIFIVSMSYSLLNGVNYALLPKVFPLALAASFLILIYYYAISKGQVSLTGTILSMYPLVTIVLSLYFLHEQPSIAQKLAIIFVLLGTFILALGENAKKLRNLKIDSWFWWGIIGAFLIGISDFLAKVGTNQTDLYTYVFAYGLAFPLVSAISFVFDKKGRKLPEFSINNFLPTVLGVSMVESGLIVYYIAISKGLVSVVTPISSVYVGITVILALIFLKEKIKGLQIFGIILSFIGIILLGLVV